MCPRDPTATHSPPGGSGFLPHRGREAVDVPTLQERSNGGGQGLFCR